MGVAPHHVPALRRPGEFAGGAVGAVLGAGVGPHEALVQEPQLPSLMRLQTVQRRVDVLDQRRQELGQHGVVRVGAGRLQHVAIVGAQDHRRVRRPVGCGRAGGVRRSLDQGWIRGGSDGPVYQRSRPGGGSERHELRHDEPALTVEQRELLLAQHGATPTPTEAPPWTPPPAAAGEAAIYSCILVRVPVSRYSYAGAAHFGTQHAFCLAMPLVGGSAACRAPNGLQNKPPGAAGDMSSSLSAGPCRRRRARPPAPVLPRFQQRHDWSLQSRPT